MTLFFINSFAIIVFLALGVISCTTSNKKNTNDVIGNNTVIDVQEAYFKAANLNTKISTVACTLSDGTKTKCYKIITNSTPTDHQMGPWCPENISDDASKGGIWLHGDKVHDVDGDFIKNLAILYGDETWKMYDDNGKIFVTKTMEDCVNAANPNVGEEYKNFCVECLPSYISDVSRSWLIPITPVVGGDITQFNKGPRGPRPDRPKDGEKRPDRPDHQRGGPGGPAGGAPATRGIALNGVEFSAPAPVSNILAAYTLAPFDDAGGHINVHQGYHYHTATGVSYSVAQEDGHAPLIGYAMDGHGIYGLLDSDKKEPKDLDANRGHYDSIRGYHYHVDAAGKNNFIDGLKGAYVNEY